MTHRDTYFRMNANTRARMRLIPKKVNVSPECVTKLRFGNRKLAPMQGPLSRDWVELRGTKGK